MTERLALGLMSGTSADGLSLAVIGLAGRRLRVAASADRPYSSSLRRRLLGAVSLRAPELASLSAELGRLYAVEAARFLKKEGIAPKRLSVVGSHGQTVAHLPEAGATLQIGEPSFLAEALGVPVVADFRPRDIAAGGQGAPLVPFFDDFVFGGGPVRVLQNIGGIANAALAGKGAPSIAFDTGPGNCLIDAAVYRMTRGRMGFDKNGRIALSGRPDARLAARLMKSPYFDRKPPKSLDRAAFDERFLARHFPAGRGRPADAVATLSYFTALSIVESCRRHMPWGKVREIVVSGGGALNPALKGLLSALASPVLVRSIADFGIAPMAKEPAAFALMALQAVLGKPNHLPAATGARGVRRLGKILY